MSSMRGLNQNKSTIQNFMNTDGGRRGEMIKKGQPVKDHMKENVLNMRAAEVRSRELRELARLPEKEAFKMAQFRDVGARVFDEPKPSSVRRLSGDAEFLTKGNAEKRRDDLALEGRIKRAELDRKMIDARNLADMQSSPRKATVPKATEVGKLAERKNSDYITKNRVKAVTMAPHSPVEKASAAVMHQDFGRVPEYLEQRKAQWEEEKEEIRRRKPDPNCPPGMCLMPEEERLETLEILKTSKTEALRQLQSLPFIIETPSLMRKQSTLESKLKEIDNALNLFDKPKVYIAR
jgi:Calmodulin-binding